MVVIEDTKGCHEYKKYKFFLVIFSLVDDSLSKRQTVLIGFLIGLFYLLDDLLPAFLHIGLVSTISLTSVR
jgi:hypothetical protein